jgi:hypothetical protein
MNNPGFKSFDFATHSVHYLKVVFAEFQLFQGSGMVVRYSPSRKLQVERAKVNARSSIENQKVEQNDVSWFARL